MVLRNTFDYDYNVDFYNNYEYEYNQYYYFQQHNDNEYEYKYNDNTIMKQTGSIGGVLDFVTEGIGNGAGKKIAGGCELTYIKLSGGGPANVTVHDCTSVAEANYNNTKMIMDSSAATNDTMIFPNPVNFTRGVVVVLQQGGGLNVTLSYGAI